MNGKRIVQVVKTFDGALWAVQQVWELIQKGWEIHVISPSLEGRYAEKWRESGAFLHQLDIEFPVSSIWKLSSSASMVRDKFNEINPNLIHSHFVSTTLMLRWALQDFPVPRIFQVPGPLHLENPIFGQWETFSSNHNDYWIASSDYIRQFYINGYGIDPRKIFLSYYGTDLGAFNQSGGGEFRKKYSIPMDALVVGNVSFIYPPKFYLAQRVGLKGHELMIESMANLMKENSNLYTVFIGNQWGVSQSYFQRLKRKATSLSKRFIFTGFLPQKEIVAAWKDFDLALHIPSSENCGGVIEPLLNEIPVVASRIGGLPEIIIPGETGHLAQSRTVQGVEDAVRNALSDKFESKRMAKNGRKLVERLFNIAHTANDIDQIYKNILKSKHPRTHY
jgi:glycosyltransferase involved in cell wall biosynthesis